MEKELKNIINKIINKFDIDKIVLFGSVAKQNYNKTSDIDLLIISEYCGKSFDLAKNIICEVKTKYSLDINVKNNEEIKTRIEQNDFFIKNIINNRILLYEKNN